MNTVEYVPGPNVARHAYAMHRYATFGGPTITEATAEFDRFVAALVRTAKREALDELTAWHRENAKDPETPTPIRRGIAVMADEAQRFKDLFHPAE